jgi:hypothetical protein
MRRTNIFTVVLSILLISAVCFGQDDGSDENWLLEFRGEYTNYERIFYQFTTFTKEDVANAKQKLKSIKTFAPKDEWEGIYYDNTPVGDSRLIWNAEGGFLDFYFYHQLKSLDFGKVAVLADMIELVSEKSLNSNPGKTKADSKFVKVKVGEVHYLIPENRLKDFCESAVGLNTDLGFINNYYWAKEEDLNKKVFGLPVLPKKYAYLIRYPIEAKIIRVGKRKIVKSESDSLFSEIHYDVIISAGKNKRIESGMNFFVEALGEWVQIEKVFTNSSVGFIRREFDEDKKEECLDSEGGSGNFIPCKKIAVGMKAKTKASDNYF